VWSDRGLELSGNDASPVNIIDTTVFRALFGLVYFCPPLGPTWQYLVNDDLLKGGLVMAAFWGLWFRNDSTEAETREYLLFAFISSVAALLLGRLLALCLPFHVRPSQNPMCDFPFPYTAAADMPRSWNTCPSDHAILFFCLATCLWFVNRPIGLFCLGFTVLGISAPRLYMGYHYPIDILVGGLLGIGAAMLATVPKIRKSLTSRILVWMQHRPSLFYAFAFLWTFETANLFRTLLKLASLLRHAAAAIF